MQFDGTDQRCGFRVVFVDDAPGCRGLYDSALVSGFIDFVFFVAKVVACSFFSRAEILSFMYYFYRHGAPQLFPSSEILHDMQAFMQGNQFFRDILW